jgi:hypothetical protein
MTKQLWSWKLTLIYAEHLMMIEEISGQARAGITESTDRMHSLGKVRPIWNATLLMKGLLD